MDTPAFSNYVGEGKKDVKVKILPIGGLGEFGKNMMAIEVNDSIIIIDCGIMFPDPGMPGVDVVIPDFSYVRANAHKVKAVLLTHGHEDHIGAVPYFIKEIDVPIYGTKFTLSLVESKLKEAGIDYKGKLKIVRPRQSVKLRHFKFKYVHTTHSIVDAAAIIISTPLGTIIHSGDFKVDFTPVDKFPFDFYSFAKAGERGVLLLMSDSTNVERAGYTRSEGDLVDSFRKIIGEANGRIILTTFSTNINRIHTVIRTGIELGKKICISGRSVETNVKLAKKLGYYNFEEKHFINVEDVPRFAHNEVVIITTGTQGEPLSALSLIAKGIHRNLKIENKDTIIISASVIPGNELIVSYLIDLLLKKGARVVYDKSADVHVSGHASKEELKLLIALTRPKFFIPLHGQHRQLSAHARLAENMGIPKENVSLASDGDLIELTKDAITKIQQFDLQHIYVDGKGIGDIGTRILKERQQLSDDGVVALALAINMTDKEIVGSVEIEAIGFIYIKENQELLQKAKDYVQEQLTDYLSRINQYDVMEVKRFIKSILRPFLHEDTHRKPILIVRIIEIYE